MRKVAPPSPVALFNENQCDELSAFDSSPRNAEQYQ